MNRNGNTVFIKIVVLRECFDLTLPFRARGHSSSFVQSGIAGLVTNFGLVLVLVPAFGITGAVAALAVGGIVEAIYLGFRLRRFLNVRVSDLLPWRTIFAVLLAGLVALGILFLDQFLPFGIWIDAAIAIPIAAVVFFGLLIVFRVEELTMLLEWIRRLVPRRGAR